VTESSSDKPVSENMKTVVVHTVQGSIEAEIVQTCLRSCGIESAIQGLAVQSVHPFTVDGMGKIKILVMEDDAEAARQIISDFLESSSESNSDQDLY
jgi:predicted dinucleotide-binding enzyme